MTEVDGLDGQDERRRRLEGTLGRIARQLRSGRQAFPSPIIYVADDEDFDFEAEAAKHPGPVVFLPEVDAPRGMAEEQAYWNARHLTDGDDDREAS